MSNVSDAEKLKAAKLYLAVRGISATAIKSNLVYTSADGRTHAPTYGQRIPTKEEVYGRLRTKDRQDNLQQLRTGNGRVSPTADLPARYRDAYRTFAYRY